MLLAGTLLIPDDTGSSRLDRGWVRLDGQRIAETGLGEPPGTPDLGGDDAIVSPGFIDAHAHLPQFDSIGADGMTLLDWLDSVIFPAEARWGDADYAGAMTQRVAHQFLSFGTTGIAAYATVHHEATKAAIQALHQSGMRAITGQVLMDRNAPPELTRPAKQLLDEASKLAGVGRVEIAVTPRFAVSCTDELLRGSGELAKKTNAPVQTHLSEMVPEVELVRELFPGISYTEVYERAGLLGPRTVLGHGIYLDDNELRTLAERRSIVAHCPTANDFLRSGAMNRTGHLAAGVRLALGSDVAGGPDRSMVRVARAMLETAKRRADETIPAAACWHQITRGNADALGWTTSGRLEPGADADLVVFTPDIPWLEDDHERCLSRLMYAWDDRWLAATIVDGRVAFAR